MPSVVPSLPSTLIHLLLVSLANTALAQGSPSDGEESEQTIAGHSGGHKNLTWEFAVIVVVVLVICTVAGIAIRSRIRKRRQQQLLDEDDALPGQPRSRRDDDLEAAASTTKPGPRPDLRATDWASSVTLTQTPSPTFSSPSVEKKGSMGKSTPPRRASPPVLPYGLRQPPRAHSPIREKH